MPPVTPSSTLRPASDPSAFGSITALPGNRRRTGSSVAGLLDAFLQALGALVPDLALGDLLERDRERLVAQARRLDERRHELAAAFAELRVVRVDLAGPLGGQRHEAELGVHGLHQVVDLGLDHANGSLSCRRSPRPAAFALVRPCVRIARVYRRPRAPRGPPRRSPPDGRTTQPGPAPRRPWRAAARGPRRAPFPGPPAAG